MICFFASFVDLPSLSISQISPSPGPKGRIAEAEAEFEKLLGGSHVKFAMADLHKSDRGDETDAVKLSELLYGRHFRDLMSAAAVPGTSSYSPFASKNALYLLIPFAVVFIGSTLFALQQLSGINAVFYFSSTVFKSAGVPSDLANVFVGIANLSGSITAMILMDKLGRKALLVWSFFGMAVAMSVQVAGASSFISGSGAVFLSVSGMLLFVLTFALGAGPVPGLLLPEIFPNRIRAKAMAVCMSVHWVILGDKFLCGLALPAFAGATWTTALVLYVLYLLLDGSGFCEEKCGGNQREITPRNRDSTSSTRIKAFFSCLQLCPLHKKDSTPIQRLKHIFAVDAMEHICVQGEWKLGQGKVKTSSSLASGPVLW
ncbi:putative plastidic glucose transporter 2 [Vitis vinifera]|uniref:Putative plastidic glucose transporter 2 n=1 Tax=Vitis vinifera TaxID=29760 RepID=A0A438DS74_VITVI|nr:putative plastidic glucose transporter 2 [Vitis vinifera]